MFHSVSRVREIYTRVKSDPSPWTRKSLASIATGSFSPSIIKSLIQYYETTTLAPYHVVKALQLNWRSDTNRWNLRMPDLQMSCSDLTERLGTMLVVPVIATWDTCPFPNETYLSMCFCSTLRSACWTHNRCMPVRQCFNTQLKAFYISDFHKQVIVLFFISASSEFPNLLRHS